MCVLSATNRRTRWQYNERGILVLHEANSSAVMKILSSLSGQCVRQFVNKTRIEIVFNLFNIQSELSTRFILDF